MIDLICIGGVKLSHSVTAQLSLTIPIGKFAQKIIKPKIKSEFVVLENVSPAICRELGGLPFGDNKCLLKMERVKEGIKIKTIGL